MRRLWFLLLLASALRFHALGVVPLHGDEAFSVVFSAMPLREIFIGTARSEPNPPLYWLLLHSWEVIAGTSEFAVRLPSALAGVVVVALTYRLSLFLLVPDRNSQFATRNSSVAQRMSLILTVLAAINPFLIWHAQEARQYSLLAALTTAAIWLTLRAIRRGGRHYFLAAALWWLALFLHYLAAFALVTAIVVVLLSAEGRRQWRPALVSLFFLGLTYLPWAIYVAPLMLGHKKGWIASTTLVDALVRTIIAFVGGTTLTDPQRIFVAVVGIGLVLIGTAFSLHSQFTPRDQQSAISNQRFAMPLLAWLPPLLLALLSLWRPAFDERFLIGTLPPVLILIALPAAHWWRSRRWLAIAGLTLPVVIAGLSLTNYFFNPVFVKSPDWRGLADYLSTHTTAGDLVLQDFKDPAFGYYYRGPAQVADAPPNPAPSEAPQTEKQLAALLDAHPRLWLFLTDSTVFSGDWLNDHAERLMDEWIFGFRLQVFDSPVGSLAAMIPFETKFADGIRLVGYRLLPSPDGRAPRAGPTVARAGGEGRFHLTLYWQTASRLVKDYTVFTHLLTAGGIQIAGQDNPPAQGRRPTSGWRTGETIIDPHDLTLPADLAPGAYSIQVGLYDPATGARLSVVDSPADSVTLPALIEIPSR